MKSVGIAQTTTAFLADGWRDLPADSVSDTLSKRANTGDIRKLKVQKRAIYNYKNGVKIDFSLSADSEKKLKTLSGSVTQVLDYLLLKVKETPSFNGVVIISVSEFMRYRGVKDRKGAKAQLDNGLSMLATTHIEYNREDIRKKKRRTKLEETYYSIGKFSILENIPDLKYGRNITVIFSNAYFPILENIEPMPYHTSLLKVNTLLYPLAIPIGREILKHKFITSGKRVEEGGGNGNEPENVLFVKTLLKQCGLPTFQQASKSVHNAYQEKVIRPFERNLDSLSEVFTWRYMKGKRVMAESFKPTSTTFTDLKVVFSFKDYPSQEKRIRRNMGRKRVIELEENPLKTISEGVLSGGGGENGMEE